MGRTYGGRIPSAEDGWQMIGSVNDDGQEWMAFQNSRNSSQEWKNFKVVVKGRAKNKANYWLGKNCQTGRFALSPDYVKLNQHRPSLYDKVEKIINQLCTKDCEQG